MEQELINVKILHLPLKAKWYDMQECGEKPEEYREVTPYWCKRFLKDFPVGWRIRWICVLQQEISQCFTAKKYILYTPTSSSATAIRSGASSTR